MNSILFGLNKNGGFKAWAISVVDMGSYALILVTHGKVGGKMQTKETKVSSGKQGRSYVEQAHAEAQSKASKQYDKGYRYNTDELEELPLLPMLANDYLKQGHRIAYPCFGSPKMDGVRCLATRFEDHVELKSRSGKLYSVPHIEEELTGVMPVGATWDGEIYKHGMFLEEIVSAVKRTDPAVEVALWSKRTKTLSATLPYDPEAHAEAAYELMKAGRIQKLRPCLDFVIFDIVSEQPFEKRLGELRESTGTNNFMVVPPDHVRVCQYCLLQDEEEMIHQHKEYVAGGYEGIMLRNKQGLYESGKRSADIQKYKHFMDAEFRVCGVVEDKNGNGVLVVWDALALHEFTVCYGSFEQRALQLASPQDYIGKWLTVKFQTRYKDSRLPQFPTGMAFRDCDSLGNPLD